MTFSASRPVKAGFLRSTEGAERRYIFWRIGERPILQKPHGLAIELHETLWAFDLSRDVPGTNQKITSLRSLRLPGEYKQFTTYFFAEMALAGWTSRAFEYHPFHLFRSIMLRVA